MRWARFERDGNPVYGIVEGDRIQPVAGSPFGDWHKAGAPVALAGTKLLIPVVPPTFYAAGANYAKHVTEMAARRALSPNLPTRAEIGYRANNALIADGEAIIIPRDATEEVQYEGELVAVVGRRAKHLSEAEALSCILGWTIGNDVSERSWQRGDRTFWRSKNTDTFKPMGPWIETDVTLDKLVTTVRLNGREMLSFATNEMVFGVAQFIAEMTRYLTLYPGDVIWMGTEGAPANMKHGDVCEIEINQIGTLRNPVVRES